MTKLERIHRLLTVPDEMNLGDKQELFSKMYMKLLIFVHDKGYGVRQKYLLRCKDCKIGHKRSLHKSSLAIDIVLTKDDNLFSQTEDYLEAGEYWESIGGSWGGRFSDGGHFSLAHNGMR